jgi:hypothetical protein
MVRRSRGLVFFAAPNAIRSHVKPLYAGLSPAASVIISQGIDKPLRQRGGWLHTA